MLRGSTDTSLVSRVREASLSQVDIAWLATFRLLFGLALFVSMLRFLLYGWIDRLLLNPFQFKYWGFSWVEPLSRTQMHALFWALSALALLVSLGLLFRVSALLLAVGLVYFQVLDVSNYLNHYYLAALLAILLAISPAGRAWSVDAFVGQRFRARTPPPQTTQAAWLFLFRFQVGVVYFFAGLAKANSDWLLHGQPLRIWLGANVDLPVLGPLFTIDVLPLLFSWFGFLFDTTVVAFLLCKKTRPYAFAVVVVFHVITRVLFPIGMFPVIMIGAALVFFSPDWPRTLARRVPSFRDAAWLRAGGASAAAPAHARASQHLLLALLVCYCLVQLALPLRYLAYGGNVLWHEQGMRFSWRVMLRAKGGSTTFVVRNKITGRTFHVSPRAYLTPMQESEMSSQPDLILQLAHHIKDDFARRGRGDVEVRAESYVALNGRRAIAFIDPSIDLTRIADGLGPATWVLPAPTKPPPHTRPVL